MQYVKFFFVFLLKIGNFLPYFIVLMISINHIKDIASTIDMDIPFVP